MKKIYCFLAFLIVISSLQAQDKKPDYWDEIQAFKKKDSLQMPAAGQVLFVGSSSFRLWDSLQSYFPSHPIINRGFGGSTLVDVIRYADDIIFKYNPKQIVIYCGENDFANSDTVTVEMVFNRFITLFDMIRRHYKKIPVVYVSMKPSPSRTKLMPKYLQANLAIKKFLKKKRKTKYVDVYHAMLNSDGSPKPEIFKTDNLHMNAKGYTIWQKLIEPYLLK